MQAKNTPRENPFTFRPGEFSDLVAVQPCSASSAVPGRGLGTHRKAPGTEMHMGNFLLFQSGYTKLAVLKQCEF